MPLYFEDYINSQKFAVVDIILSFYRNQFLKKEGYWISLVQIGLSNYFIGTSSKSQLT